MGGHLRVWAVAVGGVWLFCVCQLSVGGGSVGVGYLSLLLEKLRACGVIAQGLAQKLYSNPQLFSQFCLHKI